MLIIAGISLSSIPSWLRIVLIAIAIIFGSVVVYMFARQGTYVPGTDYASLKPEDFSNDLTGSVLVIARSQFDSL